MTRREMLRLALAAGASAVAASGRAAAAPLAEARQALAPFVHSPFPYNGIVPGKDVPFLDTVEGGRRGHAAPRAGTVYWADETYSDRRSLVFLPAGFDVAKPAAIVVYLHGNGATLARDVVGRQRIAAQVARSGINAALLAPQFAVDASDSSAGDFWTPGVFAAYLDEASQALAELHGAATADTFAALPVILVAYSGGYNPAAYALAVGGADARIAGVVLVDALYAEEDKFAAWIAGNRDRAFFVSAYTRSAAASNGTLRALLDDRGVGYRQRLPRRLEPGVIAFLATDPDLDHNDLMTSAWVPEPLAALLGRVEGFPR